MRLAVFASGTGTNFEAIARSFRNSKTVTLVCLVCDQSGAGAIEIARQYDIQTHLVNGGPYRTRLEEACEKKLADTLLSLRVDWIALAGYMRVVKAPLLDKFPGRILNIHPSLLPAFRGLHPVRKALDYGVKITGCTVHLVDEAIDHGPILGQRAVTVEEGDTEETLHQKIHREEYHLYPEILTAIAADLLKIPERVTHAPVGKRQFE